MAYFVGVDVGTGSARAALVDEKGTLLAESSYATTTWRDEKDADVFEQSTDEIWLNISKATKDVLRSAKVEAKDVKGIGFDATCSLAVSDFNGKSVTVTKDGKDDAPFIHNIVLWADHRAKKEAAVINSTRSEVLKYVGGTMSLEMELPKILWLKRHLPSDKFSQLMFFDLPDYLTYRATGSLVRSVCSLACKCGFVSAKGNSGWVDDFFTQIGLEDFVRNDYRQLGGIPGTSGLVLTAGQPIPGGLSKQAADDLGLLPGTAVGSGVIDAYAGWIGTVAARQEGVEKETTLEDSQSRLAAIAGTSTCHIVQSKEAVFVKGVWGPYKDAVFPGYWMNEGGQSSTGQLLDFMVETHPAFPALKEEAEKNKTHYYVHLQRLLEDMLREKNAPFLAALTKDVYLYPDLHGNRSPLADSDMTGVFVGLRLDKSIWDLALRYYATVEAIALQTRHIISEMNKSGHQIKSVYMSGGLVKNPLLVQAIANICGVPVVLPFSHSASVVLGSAILGAVAYEQILDHEEISDQEEARVASFAMKDRLWAKMEAMTRSGATVYPNASEAEAKLLEVKYGVFTKIISLQRKWREQVARALN